MRGSLLIAALALAALAPAARAAERVTLRNGFEIDCDHHVQVEDQVRLYLSAGEDNYIERLPEDIASIETVPDPPALPDSEVKAPRWICHRQCAKQCRGEALSGGPGRDAHQGRP